MEVQEGGVGEGEWEEVGGIERGWGERIERWRGELER